MDTIEIESVIQNYFDAIYENSGDKMSTVFHSVAHIYGHGEGGALRDMDKVSFVKLVDSQGADAPKPDYKRLDEILSIDFTGENTAAARVKVRVRNTLFTDILSFMRLDGKWAVIAKVFSGVPVP
jgi:hypothetical protein